MVGERFLIRTEGGPCDGETRVADVGQGWTWPLPAWLGYDETGRYVKISESGLPPQDAESRLRRGARYRWVPADG